MHLTWAQNKEKPMAKQKPSAQFCTKNTSQAKLLKRYILRKL
jgi:hypothetical protein